MLNRNKGFKWLVLLAICAAIGLVVAILTVKAQPPATPQPTPTEPGITSPAVPPTDQALEPPAKTVLHKYRKSVGDVNEVKVEQMQIWHWVWVPGEVDRQKLWLGAVSGEDVADPGDAAWIAASALEQMNQGLSKDDEWHVGAKRTVTPQEGVKQHFEYLVVNPDGSLTTTTNESMASWISADDAALLDLDGQGYNPYIQSLISNK